MVVNRNNSSNGFTIVELMFAMAIFAIVLLSATAAMIQIGQMYYKGVTISRTQNMTRQVMDEISRAVQFSGAEPTAPAPDASRSNAVGGTTSYSFCIGGTRYSYVLDRVLVTNPTGDAARKEYRHVLWRDTLRSPYVCPALDLSQVTPSDTETVAGSGRELMGENMRLSRLALTRMSPTGDLYRVEVNIVYGDTDLLEYGDGYATNPLTAGGNFHLACKGGASAGTQFCAVSELSTLAERRIK